MSSADDFVSAFEADTEDVKVANFEASTLAQVLKELGVPPDKARWLQRDLGPAFGFDWLCDRTGWPVDIVVGRVFRFNLVDLFTRPTRSPITGAYKAACQHRSESGAQVCYIFKCFELGRMVATNMDVTGTHIAVDTSATGVFRVARLPGFFTHHFGTIEEGLLS